MEQLNGEKYSISFYEKTFKAINQMIYKSIDSLKLIP